MEQIQTLGDSKVVFHTWKNSLASFIYWPDKKTTAGGPYSKTASQICKNKEWHFPSNSRGGRLRFESWPRISLWYLLGHHWGKAGWGFHSSSAWCIVPLPMDNTCQSHLAAVCDNLETFQSIEAYGLHHHSLLCPFIFLDQVTSSLHWRTKEPFEHGRIIKEAHSARAANCSENHSAKWLLCPSWIDFEIHACWSWPSHQRESSGKDLADSLRSSKDGGKG